VGPTGGPGSGLGPPDVAAAARLAGRASAARSIVPERFAGARAARPWVNESSSRGGARGGPFRLGRIRPHGRQNRGPRPRSWGRS